MTWSWRYTDGAGRPVAAEPAAGAFASREAAESWLGEKWRELLDAGVQEVVLVEGERDEYAMPLTPAEG